MEWRLALGIAIAVVIAGISMALPSSAGSHHWRICILSIASVQLQLLGMGYLIGGHLGALMLLVMAGAGAGQLVWAVHNDLSLQRVMLILCLLPVLGFCMGLTVSLREALTRLMTSTLLLPVLLPNFGPNDPSNPSAVLLILFSNIMTPIVVLLPVSDLHPTQPGVDPTTANPNSESSREFKE